MTKPPVQTEWNRTAGAALDNHGKKIPRRDWWLLPLLSLLTVVLLSASAELAARRMFTESQTGMDRCMVLDDPSTGARGIPNSVCWEKSPENPAIEFRFNSCGHRAGMECGPKAPGTFRIVMIGSSVPMGERVQREESFAALLPRELSRETGRPVELYNESMGWGFSHSTRLRFSDVLAQHPDMILWVLTPMDVERADVVLPAADMDPYAGMSLREKAWRRMQADLASKSLLGAMAELFGHSKTALLLRHFLYGIQSQYVRSFLAGPDGETGYLKNELSPFWRKRLRQVDSDATEMEERARAAGVPLVAVFLPERAQAAMISTGDWPPGFDPYKLDVELRAIVERHGGVFVDVLGAYRGIANPERYYFPVDGHPSPAGHALIAGIVAKALAGGDGLLPGMKAAR